MSLNEMIDDFSNISQKFLKKDGIVFSEGDFCDGKMYFVLEGLLGIYKNKPGGENMVREVSSGMFFGEMGMIVSGKRAATVRVLSDKCKLGMIDKDIFVKLCNTHPNFLLALLRNIIKNFITAEEKIQHLEERIVNMENGKVYEDTIKSVLDILDMDSPHVEEIKPEDNPFHKN
ncbi:MAG: cyclic nucleotide-binding domain-containing protein [Leptospiraceae bacterium]|nr:cyclic nucleotide-binding domain-containing protein [Leptospiraceae bacterium]MCP5512382.1 cyclic nucleotide-binding domain-containing protein [Leptospiraceae bacterium]